MEFQDVLKILNQSFPIESQHYNLNEENVLGVFCRVVQKAETTASSNSNIQENASTISNFFPVLENSEEFPHTRLRVDAVAPKSSIERTNTPAGEVIQDLKGNINYRRKIQNSYPYIQLSVGGELLELKNSMIEGDEIVFVRLKDNQNYKYVILLSSQKNLGAHRQVWINDALVNSNRIKPLISLDFIDVPKPKSISASDYNVIYFGAPGTGKSYQIRKDYDALNIKEGNIEVVTFYPEYDYFSFIGGYKPNNGADGIEYSFVEQVFIKIYKSAWKSVKDGNSEELYLLIIEELNRGNCAEIFGDIFQLLDRNPDYAVTPSKELSQHIIKELGSDHPAIQNGKLRLPPNLLIWATMNTSDQSLFPLDSAFKRRWTWKYMPINYDLEDESNLSASFRININDKESFSWLEFIKQVNELIRGVSHLGEDKCLGNYFINPENSILELDEFINKVLFYIWCDVFRDEESEFYDGASFYDLYNGEKSKEEQIKELLKHLSVKIY